MSIIRIENAYIVEYKQDDEVQAYLLTLDLMDNTIENVDVWTKFFANNSRGNKLTITIESADEEDK